MFLYRIRSSFGFHYFSLNFGVFLGTWESLKSTMAYPRWPPFGDNDVMVMSLDANAKCCGPQREHPWTNQLPVKFHYHSFRTVGVIEGDWKFAVFLSPIEKHLLTNDCVRL